MASLRRHNYDRVLYCAHQALFQLVLAHLNLLHILQTPYAFIMRLKGRSSYVSGNAKDQNSKELD